MRIIRIILKYFQEFNNLKSPAFQNNTKKKNINGENDGPAHQENREENSGGS